MTAADTKPMRVISEMTDAEFEAFTAECKATLKRWAQRPQPCHQCGRVDCDSSRAHCIERLR